MKAPAKGETGPSEKCEGGSGAGDSGVATSCGAWVPPGLACQRCGSPGVLSLEQHDHIPFPEWKG